MARAYRHRAPDLRRRRAFRDPKRKFLVVSEGRNAEPLYLRALARASNTMIEIFPGAGTPEIIANTAIEEAKQRGVIGRRRKGLAWYERTDEVWAVFDRDEHQHYDEALKLCETNGIKVGRSNPCFEVWLILHYEDFHRPDERSEVLSHLCKLCPEYREGKGREADFDKMMGCLEQAEQRAEAQLISREKEGRQYGPPSTTLFKLTRSIWKRA